MRHLHSKWAWALLPVGLVVGLLALAHPANPLFSVPTASAAGWRPFGSKHKGECVPDGAFIPGELGGDWYWHRSPEQEARMMAARYNRYCIRCHGVDGRGVWDIPDVPDLSNGRWQETRTDAQFARAILEGRGAVMPAFRGTLAYEEAWAMARYLRTFVAGAETSRPALDDEDKAKETAPGVPTPKRAKPAAPAPSTNEASKPARLDG